jgi:hypothetical protein
MGIDAWLSLATAAMRTERIRLGPILSPVSRTRPWKLASEAATLDNLFNGCVVFPVGLGDIDEFEPFGETIDRKILAKVGIVGTLTKSAFGYESFRFVTPASSDAMKAGQARASASPGFWCII